MASAIAENISEHVTKSLLRYERLENGDILRKDIFPSPQNCLRDFVSGLRLDLGDFSGSACSCENSPVK